MFFDIGWTEIALIGGVALIAIGPKELPGALRTAGQWVGKARRLAQDFQSQFQEALREADIAEMKKQFDDAANAAAATPSSLLGSTVNDVKDALALDAPDGNRPPASRLPKRRSRPCSTALRQQAMSRRRPPRRRQATRRHEPGRHRRHQGAAAGSSHRTSLAPDQGADRVRPGVHRLFLLLQADLQRADLALCLGRRRGEFEIHLHGAARTVRHAPEARDVRRGFHLVPDRRRADLQVRRAGSLPQRATRPSCRT